MDNIVYLGEFTDGKDTWQVICKSREELETTIVNAWNAEHWQEVRSVEDIRNMDDFDDTACYIYEIPLGEVILK